MGRLADWIDQMDVKRPPYIARAERRQLYWYFGALVGMFVFVVIVGWIAVNGRMPAWTGMGSWNYGFVHMVTYLPVFFVIQTVYIVTTLRARREWKRRAVAAENRLCLECAYDLSALSAGNSDGQVTCPECGASVNIREAQRLWYRSVNGKARPEG